MTDRAELARVLAEQEAGLAALAPIRDLIADCGLAALTVGADVLDAEKCLRQLATILNGSDPLDRRVIRNRAIAELKRVKLTDAAGMVDAALPGSTSTPGTEEQGRAVTLSDPEPWPEKVNGPELLSSLTRTYSRLVALPPGGATALALWTVHAHALDAAAVSPLLVLASPEKRCGKTTTLKVLGALVPRPLPAASISPAALFRAVEMFTPSLMLDEADTAFRDNEELRAIVNSAHDRASAIVVRTVGEQHTPRAFSTWCAKAIALIGRLPGTLADRAITLPMRRRRRDEKVERLRLDRLGQLEPLRRQAARWAKDNLDELRAADPPTPESLNDRAADNWRALLAIADQAGNDWPVRARKAAGTLSGAEDDEDAPAVLLLSDLRGMFADRGTDRLPSEEIVGALVKMEDRPWPEWHHGRPLTVRQLAKLVGRFHVRPKQIWAGDRNVRGYVLADFTDPFARYLPSESLEPLEAKQDKRLGAVDDSLDPSPPSTSDKRISDCGTTGLVDLADESPSQPTDEEIERAAIEAEGA